MRTLRFILLCGLAVSIPMTSRAQLSIYGGENFTSFDVKSGLCLTLEDNCGETNSGYVYSPPLPNNSSSKPGVIGGLTFYAPVSGRFKPGIDFRATTEGGTPSGSTLSIAAQVALGIL